ncbi:hypothetical protein [Butyrivibrio sp. AE3003]|uniref:hypothetical protein n=1 Tax=Butyrivibrio sp. AE3003 TaxID=1496721 RepID=UPI001A98E8B4|nr:hypothetical protein [Butyrivibrio sp. AE3003]
MNAWQQFYKNQLGKWMNITESSKKYVDKCEMKQRQMFDRFLNTFEYNLETGENYDQAVLAIARFADEAGIVLQHVSFDEFSNAMRSKEPFVLK